MCMYSNFLNKSLFWGPTSNTVVAKNLSTRNILFVTTVVNFEILNIHEKQRSSQRKCRKHDNATHQGISISQQCYEEKCMECWCHWFLASGHSLHYWTRTILGRPPLGGHQKFIFYYICCVSFAHDCRGSLTNKGHRIFFMIFQRRCIRIYWAFWPHGYTEPLYM